jgi:hypothetical protein
MRRERGGPRIDRMQRFTVVALGLGLVLALSCTGMRPALDRAGPELARTPEERAAMHYLGDGCYIANRTVFACSIDALPAGEMACAIEPAENGRVVELPRVRYRGGAYEEYYDRDLDSFIADLNAHRCHQRWYDTLQAGPVPLTVRDARAPRSRRFVPLAELGLTGFPQTMEVPSATARRLCLRSPTEERWVTAMCAEPDGRVIVDDSLLRTGLFDDPDTECYTRPCWLRRDLNAVIERTVRGTPGASRRCAVAEIHASPLGCRSVIPGAVRAAPTA